MCGVVWRRKYLAMRCESVPARRVRNSMTRAANSFGLVSYLKTAFFTSYLRVMHLQPASYQREQRRQTIVTSWRESPSNPDRITYCKMVPTDNPLQCVCASVVVRLRILVRHVTSAFLNSPPASSALTTIGSTYMTLHIISLIARQVIPPSSMLSMRSVICEHVPTQHSPTEMPSPFDPFSDPG
jgi:hypothetical protein